MKKLSGEAKLFLGIIGVTVALIVGALALFSQPAHAFSRSDLLPAGTPVKGNPDAKVFLVEFSDFQCPACKAVSPIVDALITQYKDTMVFGYRYYPLDQHPYGRKSAMAAAAAGEQGKFWEMHDLLLQNQDTLSDEAITNFAKQLNLRMEAFTQDMASEKIKQRIDNDKAYGNQLGLQATPTFYLNGEKLDLTNFNDLKKAVEEAIKSDTR